MNILIVIIVGGLALLGLIVGWIMSAYVPANPFLSASIGLVLRGVVGAVVAGKLFGAG